MRVLGHLALSWFTAFFLCGAVVFPLLNPYYMNRVFFSAGLAGILYGLESVVRAGHIETCGLLSGNCGEHSLRAAGLVLWVAGFVALTVRHATRNKN